MSKSILSLVLFLSLSVCSPPQLSSELVCLIITSWIARGDPSQIYFACSRIFVFKFDVISSELDGPRRLFVLLVSCLVSGNKMNPTSGSETAASRTWQIRNLIKKHSHAGIISGVFHCWGTDWIEKWVMQYVSCGIRFNHELIAVLCKWWCSMCSSFIALLTSYQILKTHCVLFYN